MRTIKVGRGQDNDVVLQDSCVSRHHCQLTQYDDSSVIIADCGSTNGTFVNGRRISGNTMLKWSDSVKLGNMPFQWTSYVNAPRYKEPQTTFIPHDNYAEPTPRKSKNKGKDVDYHSVNDVNINYNEGGFGRKFGQAAGDSAGNIVGCFLGFVIVIVIIAVLGIISF